MTARAEKRRVVRSSDGSLRTVAMSVDNEGGRPHCKTLSLSDEEHERLVVVSSVRGVSQSRFLREMIDNAYSDFLCQQSSTGGTP